MRLRTYQCPFQLLVLLAILSCISQFHPASSLEGRTLAKERAFFSDDPWGKRSLTEDEYLDLLGAPAYDGGKGRLMVPWGKRSFLSDDESPRVRGAYEDLPWG